MMPSAFGEVPLKIASASSGTSGPNARQPLSVSISSSGSSQNIPREPVRVSWSSTPFFVAAF
jgi:hypothetical protein